MRKLAIACAFFALSIFLCGYILPIGWLPALSAGFAVLSGAAIVFRRRTGLAPAIALTAAALGLLYSHAYFELHGGAAEKLAGSTVELSAIALESPEQFDDFSRCRVLIVSQGLPRLRALVYDDGDALSDVLSGQTVTLTARLSRADIRHGERYDGYYSSGVYLILNARSSVRVADERRSALALPSRLNEALVAAADRVFDSETAAVARALMLGDRSGLYENDALYLALKRSGMMHIVAVSGMHMIFLVGLLQLLFGKTGRSSLICIVCIWAFALITGFSPSAVRSAIMQTFLLLAPVLRRENDGVTSLSFALALLLVLNPDCCRSLSLQLSFAAVAGMMLISERMQRALLSPLKKGPVKRFLRFPAGVLSASAGATAFTLPLSALYFGSVAILSPLTNLLALWAASFSFCGAYISCALSAVWPAAAEASAFVVRYLIQWFIFACKFVSNIPFSVIYTDVSLNRLWIPLCYMLAALGYFMKAKPMLRVFVPCALSAATLALGLFTTAKSYEHCNGVISVLDVGQGQSVCFMSGDATVVVDCGGSYYPQDAGETAGEYLLSRGRRNIDVLILTHLHSDHVNGVTMLMNMLPVRKLVILENAPDNDGLLDGILSAAAEAGTELCYIGSDAALSCGGITAELFAPIEDVGEMNEQCLCCRISIGSYNALMTGDSSKDVENALCAKHGLGGTELLVVGHHGSRYSSSGALLSALGGDTAVISCGYNSFGHPTQEALERLAAYGYNIYRTDLNSDVEIRLG